MAENKILFRKVTIIGVGLIGGSIGMAIKKNGVAREVVGLARRHGPLVSAVRNGAIDRFSHDLKKAVAGADLVIFATPVKTIMNLFPKAAKFLKRGCIVTDVGSTKAEIVEAARKNLPPWVNFIGSHPMAGSEKGGVMYGHADLFKDSVCLITPIEKTSKAGIQRITQFWNALGATVKTLSPKEHDEALAYVSHMPHLLAYGLMHAVPDVFLAYAANGFKDTTRIASSDAKLWNDVCMANTKNILKALDECVKNLASIRKSISTKNSQELIEFLREAQKKSESIR